MKKTIFTFLWVFASFVVGLGILGILMISGLYFPPHTEVTSEAVSHETVYTGVTIWVFLVAIPFLALVLGIRGSLPGTARRPNATTPPPS
jgi:hypothetical protein